MREEIREKRADTSAEVSGQFVDRAGLTSARYTECPVFSAFSFVVVELLFSLDARARAR